MNRWPSARSVQRPPLAAIALALLLAGCGDTLKPVTALTPRQVADLQLFASFRPTSAVAAVESLLVCYRSRDSSHYALLLSANFRFAFAPDDSSGNTFLDRCFLRVDELASAGHLFIEGTAIEPPASSISLDLGPTKVIPDPRRGKNPEWHMMAWAPVTLTIQAGTGGFYVTSVARFYLVRGDSAQVPADLAARGMSADSGRWWIERWEEETPWTPISAGPRLLPAHNITWGGIKALYR